MSCFAFCIIKKHIQLVTLDRPAPVQHLDGLSVVVSRNSQQSAEWNIFRGRNENIARPDFVAVCRDAIGVFPAAFSQVQGQYAVTLNT